MNTTEPTNTQTLDNLEVISTSAIESLERAAVDVQVSTAHRYPRSIELFKKRALAMATMDAETADSCIYVREVGSKQVNGKWVKEYAEGPSVRLAEIVFNAYGNIRAAADIIEQTPRYVKAQGWAWDMETNAASKTSVVEPTVKKNGEPYSESHRVTVAKAAQAKAWRDAVIRVVGRAMCKPIIEAAKKVAAGDGKSLDDRRNKAKGWLVYRKVEEARVFAVLGVNGWSEVGEDQLVILSGLKNGILDGEMTIDEAFPPLNPAGERGPDPTPLERAKTSQDKPHTPEPAKTPTAAETPSQSQTQSVPEDEESALAAVGLAPEQTGTPFVPNQNESQPLQEVRELLHRHGKTEAQLIDVLRKNKVMKDEQKSVSELSEKKLQNIKLAWSALLGQMA